MSLETIAERYARALYELSVENGNVDVVVNDVQSVNDLYLGNEDLRAVLDNPVLDETVRAAILAELMESLHVDPMVTSTIGLLAARSRLVLLPFLVRTLRRLADDGAGIVRADVVSAVPLPETYVAKLQAELARATGKHVVVECSVDPTLLGGLITRIGDRVFDGSVRTQLKTLKQTLLAS